MAVKYLKIKRGRITYITFYDLNMRRWNWLALDRNGNELEKDPNGYLTHFGAKRGLKRKLER